MKKAVLTGATGFLGFALLTELIKNDISVYALCRKNSNRLSRLKGCPGVTVIETDLNSVDKIDAAYDCDVFYHLAWEGGRNDFDEQYKNIDMSVNCLRLAAKLGCRRFICTGSQAEYGSVSDLITEEMPLQPATAYGACKVAAYYLTMDLAKRLSIDYTWTRVFSVYGPNDNPNTLIMSVIRDLCSKGKAALDTDAEHVWNYIYEKDAAEALYLLGCIPQSDTVYNLAGTDNKPLRKYVEEVRETINTGASVCYGKQKSGVNLNVSVSKLLRDTGWRPQTSFGEGINEIKKNI